MKNLSIHLTLFAILLAGGQAQTSNNQKSNTIFVLSKAGSPVPRPSVPVRYVPMPQGASQGYNYYYGYGYGGGYGYNASSASTSSASSSSSGSLPGYNTRPRFSKTKKKG